MPSLRQVELWQAGSLLQGDSSIKKRAANQFFVGSEHSAMSTELWPLGWWGPWSCITDAGVGISERSNWTLGWLLWYLAFSG